MYSLANLPRIHIIHIVSFWFNYMIWMYMNSTPTIYYWNIGSISYKFNSTGAFYPYKIICLSALCDYVNCQVVPTILKSNQRYVDLAIDDCLILSFIMMQDMIYAALERNFAKSYVDPINSTTLINEQRFCMEKLLLFDSSKTPNQQMAPNFVLLRLRYLFTAFS